MHGYEKTYLTRILTVQSKQPSVDFSQVAIGSPTVSLFFPRLLLCGSICPTHSAAKDNPGLRATDLSQRPVCADDARFSAVQPTDWRSTSQVHPQRYNRCWTSLAIFPCVTFYFFPDTVYSVGEKNTSVRASSWALAAQRKWRRWGKNK